MPRKVPYFVTQVASSTMILFLSISAMWMALAIITEPNPEVLITDTPDAWAIVLGGFGVALGVGLGLSLTWLLVVSAWGCSAWYLAITLHLTFASNAGDRPWTNAILTLTVACVYAIMAVYSLKVFSIIEDEE